MQQQQQPEPQQPPQQQHPPAKIGSKFPPLVVAPTTKVQQPVAPTTKVQRQPDIRSMLAPLVVTCTAMSAEVAACREAAEASPLPSITKMSVLAPGARRPMGTATWAYVRACARMHAWLVDCRGRSNREREGGRTQGSRGKPPAFYNQNVRLGSRRPRPMSTATWAYTHARAHARARGS